VAIKLDYVIRETGSNLVRNVTLTLASVLTVVVSLTLFGSALLLNRGVQNANERFKGGIEFIVYMRPEVTPEQRASLQKALEENPQVKQGGIHFVDQDATYEEFKRLFKSSPQLVESVSADVLPPSFRVEPTIKDPDVVQALGDQFRTKPGVYDVVFAFEAVKRIQGTYNQIGKRFYYAAGLLLVAALMLILNTIRVAMFARRREIEVMKLVGATNWFIRVPFIIEGMIQTLLGAVVAVGIMTLGIRPFIDDLSDPTRKDILAILQGFTITDSNLLVTNIVVVVVAALIGAIGSGVAVSRFLDV
jgi:cell division transport system permease protein